MAATIADLIDHALAAQEELAAKGEAIEDEWQYVRDLGIVWRGRLEAVAAARGAAPAGPDVEAGIAAAIAESHAVTDPHRAIDWLSTFPQVVLLALGEAA